MFVTRRNKIKLVRRKSCFLFGQISIIYDLQNRGGPLPFSINRLFYLYRYGRGAYPIFLRPSVPSCSARSRAVWQLARLITLRSRVQILSPQHFCEIPFYFVFVVINDFFCWEEKKVKRKIELLYSIHYYAYQYAQQETIPTESFYSTLLHHGRIAGIEPASSPWQREILPFDHIRIFFVPDTYAYVHTYMIYHICVWIRFAQGQIQRLQ